MSVIRKNGIVGIIEGDNAILHFSEWCSGEGLDLTLIDSTDTVQRFHLNLDELHSVVIAALAANMIDLDECIIRAEELKKP